jgi:hypothetical protein
MTLTEYNPQIYPFFLRVAKGADESLLDERYNELLLIYASKQKGL